jgi:hypothetical protein
MKQYFKNGYAYFYDTNIRLWTLYPVDANKNRIEWDGNDNPIEAEYFTNKKELEKRIAQ